MFRKFIDSYWFNALLAALAAFFAVMQEVWIGTDLAFAGLFPLAGLAGIGLSFGATILSCVLYHSKFDWKNIIIGAVVGVVVALITTLCVL